jgi:phenylalanine-4-hydroxylase
LSKNLFRGISANQFTNREFISLRTNKNQPGLLNDITSVIKDRGLQLNYIDGQTLTKSADGLERVKINLSYDKLNNSDYEALKASFGEMGIKVSKISPAVVEWFPLTEKELDKMGNELQKPEDGLNQDHPGFTDKEYLERRNLIADTGAGYKMGDPIPGFDYNEKETNLWTFIWEKLYPGLMEHGCKEYKQNFKKLEEAGLFRKDKIPQLEDLNQFLKKETNWRIKPVNGILSQREFLYCLAFRTFCCTQYIRHYSKPEYTPEPDIMHEFMGHVPMFADPIVCDISQLIGRLSLGASDAQVAQLGSIYWFTIEFGLCYENNLRKFYGAGVASSYGEMNHMVQCEDNRPLDLIDNPPPVDFVVQDVQPFYVVAESFQDTLDQLEHLGNSFYKPFNLIYNEDENGYEVDRSVHMNARRSFEGLEF